MTQSHSEINLSGETFETIPTAIITEIFNNTTQAKIQRRTSTARYSWSSQILPRSESEDGTRASRNGSGRVKEWITRNAPSKIAEKQRQFQEKSDEEKQEKREITKNQISVSTTM